VPFVSSDRHVQVVLQWEGRFFEFHQHRWKIAHQLCFPFELSLLDTTRLLSLVQLGSEGLPLNQRLLQVLDHLLKLVCGDWADELFK
jgi:hypothetical protein